MYDHGGVDQFLKYCGDRDIRDEWRATVPDEMRAAIKSVEHVGRHSESMDGWVDLYVAHIDDETLFDMTGGIDCESMANVATVISDNERERIRDVMYALELAVHTGHDDTLGHDCCGRTFSHSANIIHVDDIFKRITLEHDVRRNV